MKQPTYEILAKLESIAIVVLLTSSVFFFSTVSVLSKFYIFLLLFLLLLVKTISVGLSTEKNVILDKATVVAMLVFLSYLYLNIIFAKVHFDAKIEYLNFILYFSTFLVFSVLSTDRFIAEILKTSFLVISGILLILRILSEKIIYFFVYNPNIIAGYCLMMILWVFGCIKQEKEIDFIQITILCTSFLLLILLKSLSSIFVILSIILYSFLKTKLIAISIIVSLGIVGIVINFNSFIDRLIWNIIGIRIWLENFLLGVGLGGFKFLYPSYLRNISILPSTSTIYIHNYFLHLCSETGIIGLILFLYFVYVTLNNKNIASYTYPVYGIMVQNLVDYNLLIPQNSILLFAFFGLLQRQSIKCSLTKSIITFFLALIITFAGFTYSFKMHKVFMLLNSKKIEDLYKATKLDETCWYVWRKLGMESIKEDNIYKAKKMFVKTVQTNPYDAESWFYLAVISFKLNEKQKAYRYFKTAVLLQPRVVEKYLQIFKTL